MAIPQRATARDFPEPLLQFPVVAAPQPIVPAHRTPAILGGAPAFTEALHVGRPNVGNRERLQKRIDAMLDARWFSNGGPLVGEFETRIASHLGVKHCIATCNGTTALMLAIRGLDLKGEVIVPSFTFVATAHALQWQQTKPVFCDVDPLTHNLDPRDVERYGKNSDGNMMLAARRLVEAGVPFVFVPFSPGWDFHGSATKSCIQKLPPLDAALASLLQDLDDRGLLETTIVTVLGEMGRGPIWKDPGYSGPPGRNHWATTQFVLVAGGGFKQGMILGKTDDRAQYVTHDWYSPVSYGRTLYHLLGIDADRELYTTEGRPVKIIMDDAPLIKEILA